MSRVNSGGRIAEPHSGNSGTPWSEVDDRDIRWCVVHGQTVAEIADFNCRPPTEVEARIRALRLPVPDSKNVIGLKR